jgi:1-deoxyxylulose-5-phosphate synthase
MSKQASIGLGCVTFGREIDEVDSFAMMDHAVAHSIKMFDTAAAYGSGASERIIGLWLAAKQPSEPIVIATKILPPFEPDNIEASVDTSLERLGIDAIDILYLHRWDQSCETIESLSVLDNLIRKGKIKTLGASNFSASQLQKLLQMQLEHNFFPIRFVQNNHNLAVSDIDNAFRHICTENAIEIITYSPLGAGFLTGKYHEQIEYGSRFDLIPDHQKIYFQETSFRRLERLQSIALRTGYTPVYLALAWALHQDVSTVLVGGRKPKHIDQAIEALSFFDAATFAELDAIR